MAYLVAGSGKPISEEGAEVYFDALKLLPVAAIKVAARRALLESTYPVFPPLGVLWKLACAAYQRAKIAEENAWIEVHRNIPLTADWMGFAASMKLPSGERSRDKRAGDKILAAGCTERPALRLVTGRQPPSDTRTGMEILEEAGLVG
jgi:hypothetical protein